MGVSDAFYKTTAGLAGIGNLRERRRQFDALGPLRGAELANINDLIRQRLADEDRNKESFEVTAGLRARMKGIFDRLGGLGQDAEDANEIANEMIGEAGRAQRRAANEIADQLLEDVASVSSTFSDQFTYNDARQLRGLISSQLASGATLATASDAGAAAISAALRGSSGLEFPNEGGLSAEDESLIQDLLRGSVAPTGGQPQSFLNRQTLGGTGSPLVPRTLEGFFGETTAGGIRGVGGFFGSTLPALAGSIAEQSSGSSLDISPRGLARRRP